MNPIWYTGQKRRAKIDYPLMYFRCVDDTFCLFKNEKDADSFLIELNSMHPSLKESNHQLAFLDVFVHETSAAFLTSVYRKPTKFLVENISKLEFSFHQPISQKNVWRKFCQNITEKTRDIFFQIFREIPSENLLSLYL